MTTPYENGYQLGVQHRKPVGGVLSASREQKYQKDRDARLEAYGWNEEATAAFDEGYLRGRYGMGARKVGGGNTPW